MKKLHFTFSVLLLLNLFSCQSQTEVTENEANLTSEKKDKIVGGAFENREYMYHGMPESILPIDTSAGWNQPGEKILIKGKMFKKDGRTPAPGVVLYYYHTDITGLYSNQDGLDKRVLRHGYIRSWVKSDDQGNYAIYTVKPAPYPNLGEPAHIHPCIKEPGYIEYWIDEFVFDDDPLLTDQYKTRLRNRGGSGILSLQSRNGVQVAEHNIILGKNIPGY